MTGWGPALLRLVAEPHRSCSGGPLPPPLTPSIRTTDEIGPGAHGLLAAVQPQEGCTYSWTVRVGGTVNSGGGTSQISFGAGAGSSLTRKCTVTNADGVAATGTLVVPVPTGGLNPLPATTVGGSARG